MALIELASDRRRSCAAAAGPPAAAPDRPAKRRHHRPVRRPARAGATAPLLAAVATAWTRARQPAMVPGQMRAPRADRAAGLIKIDRPAPASPSSRPVRHLPPAPSPGAPLRTVSSPRPCTTSQTGGLAPGRSGPGPDEYVASLLEATAPGAAPRRRGVAARRWNVRPAQPRPRGPGAQAGSGCLGRRSTGQGDWVQELATRARRSRPTRNG
jgi:hypothetical protein